MKDQNQNDIICSHECKICYTEREAGSIINTCKRHNYSNWGVGQKYKPMRKYYCKDCGFYHLSHLKSYVFEAKQFKHPIETSMHIGKYSEKKTMVKKNFVL